MKRNLVVSVVVLFLVGILMSGFGDATYENIVNFGHEGIEGGSLTGCSINEKIGEPNYCYGYFGNYGSKNDACACDSQNNKVVCCASQSERDGGGDNGRIYVCNKNSYTYSATDEYGTYSIDCKPTLSTVYPSCGDASGVFSEKEPLKQYLCSSGTEERVYTATDGIRWYWGCVGQNTGWLDNTAWCFAPKIFINANSWANMNGSSISSADQGDTVFMVLEGIGLTNQLVWYTPEEYNSSSHWNYPSSWWKSVRWNETDKISEKVYRPWGIPSNDYTKRFTALINLNGVNDSDGQVWNQSLNLSINPYNNSRPIIGNVIPADGMKVSVGTNVWFNQTTTDEDDLLRITWDFGDGTPDAIFQNYSSYVNPSSANVKHNYTNPGVYSWELSVTEMSRGGELPVSVSRKIEVYQQGINVKPVISSPISGTAYGERLVLFNATQSYVLNCVPGVVPDQNKFAFRTDDGVLNCSYIHKPGAISTPGYKLTANWTLGDSRGDSYRAGLWNTTDSTGRGFSSFTYLYGSSGVHNIKLRLIYED